MSDQYIPEKALFIYAHPDDIEFGVAGTAAVWAAGGCEISYIIITDGNVGSHDEEISRETLAATRRNEQEAAAKMIGVKRCRFLGYNDGLLEPTMALRKELVRLIRLYQPNAVVCGDPTSFFPSENRINHPDHRAAATAAVDAVFPACEMRLLYPDLLEQGYLPHKPNYAYISNPAGKANYYVNISSQIEMKIAALRQHVSQLGEWDPEKPLKEWAKGIGAKVGFDYAERYRRITLKEPEEK